MARMTKAALVKEAQAKVNLVQMRDMDVLDIVLPQRVELVPGLAWNLHSWYNRWHPSKGLIRYGITMEALSRRNVYTSKACDRMIEVMTELKAILEAKGL